jgi:hypothetical protein
MNSALIVDTETLKFNGVGLPTGNIWLEIDGKPFPMRCWNDFIVVLLGWWTGALLKLIRGESVSEDVGFMDGPYTVEVAAISSEMFRLRALQGEDRTDEICAGEVVAKDFIQKVILQARDVLNACQQNVYRSKDVEILEVALKNLECEVK